MCDVDAVDSFLQLDRCASCEFSAQVVQNPLHDSAEIASTGSRMTLSVAGMSRRIRFSPCFFLLYPIFGAGLLSREMDKTRR